MRSEPCLLWRDVFSMALHFTLSPRQRAHPRREHARHGGLFLLSAISVDAMKLPRKINEGQLDPSSGVLGMLARRTGGGTGIGLFSDLLCPLHLELKTAPPLGLALSGNKAFGPLVALGHSPSLILSTFYSPRVSRVQTKMRCDIPIIFCFALASNLTPHCKCKIMGDGHVDRS